MEKREAYARFWRGKLKERDHLEDSGINGMIILRWIFKNWYVGAWAGFIWSVIGTGGGHLFMR
jgi:hypothetical protein